MAGAVYILQSGVGQAQTRSHSGLQNVGNRHSQTNQEMAPREWHQGLRVIGCACMIPGLAVLVSISAVLITSTFVSQSG